MNLQSAVSIYGGGQGSGCNGPNCGRPAKKAGDYNKDLVIKKESMKNMHGMANMLLAHNFQRESSASKTTLRQTTSSSRSSQVLGSVSTWKKPGKEESPNKPGEMKSWGDRFRFHTVRISPAGWHHTSNFQGDYQDHGRGLSADSLDKSLKDHGL